MSKTYIHIGLILITFFFNENSGYSQGVSNRKVEDLPWKYALRIGGSYDIISLQQGADYKFGYKAGVVAEKRLIYNLYFQPSLSFVQKGYTYNLPYYSKRDVNAQMIELVGSLMIKFGDERKSRGLFLSTSPYISYGVGGKTKTTDLRSVADNYGTINEETFSKTMMKSMDVGFQVGLGYDINKNFELGGTYIFGLQSILRTANFMWRGYQFHLSYFF